MMARYYEIISLANGIPHDVFQSTGEYQSDPLLAVALPSTYLPNDPLRTGLLQRMPQLAGSLSHPSSDVLEHQ
jgi:hypothetical protein